jgi:hypothetical protein
MSNYGVSKVWKLAESGPIASASLGAPRSRAFALARSHRVPRQRASRAPQCVSKVYPMRIPRIASTSSSVIPRAYLARARTQRASAATRNHIDNCHGISRTVVCVQARWRFQGTVPGTPIQIQVAGPGGPVPSRISEFTQCVSSGCCVSVMRRMVRTGCILGVSRCAQVQVAPRARPAHTCAPRFPVGIQYVSTSYPRCIHCVSTMRPWYSGVSDAVSVARAQRCTHDVSMMYPWCIHSEPMPFVCPLCVHGVYLMYPLCIQCAFRVSLGTERFSHRRDRVAFVFNARPVRAHDLPVVYRTVIPVRIQGVSTAYPACIHSTPSAQARQACCLQVVSRMHPLSEAHSVRPRSTRGA